MSLDDYVGWAVNHDGIIYPDAHMTIPDIVYVQAYKNWIEVLGFQTDLCLFIDCGEIQLHGLNLYVTKCENSVYAVVYYGEHNTGMAMMSVWGHDDAGIWVGVTSEHKAFLADVVRDAVMKHVLPKEVAFKMLGAISGAAL